jgi:hypothetical protein
MNRGRRGEQVFVSKDDDECFIAVLQASIALFALRVSAYCLMTTTITFWCKPRMQTFPGACGTSMAFIRSDSTHNRQLQYSYQYNRKFQARVHSNRGLAQRIEQVRQIVMRQGQTFFEALVGWPPLKFDGNA